MKSHPAIISLSRESAGERRKWLLLAAIALMTLPSTRLVNAQGILYFVNTNSDTIVLDACEAGAAGCSLRGAIQAANSHAGADGIEIDLPAGSVINLTGALPDLTEGVSIFGPGANLMTVRRNTGGSYRIFNVATTGAVTFSGLTISNGLTTSNGDGGGINNNSGGTVNVTNCVLSSNIATRGGGISNNGSGTVNVTNGTLTSNSANDSGGGISNNSFGTVNVTNSTLSGNLANEFGTGFGSCGGGGICNGDTFNSMSGILNVTNSTLSGNIAFHGGGISTVAGGTATVTNSTLSGNTVGFSNSGGGISSDSTGPVNVRGSIIALSTGGSSSRDVSGIFVSGGFNLIGKTDGSTGFTAATDQTGTIALPLDPKLDPNGLQNNGGPTQTIALLLGSPAIDKGTSNGLTGTLTTDQRGVGYSRTIDKPSIANATGGDGTDVGAFEFGAHIKAVSRKTHGTAGNFDIKLPLTGPALGVECRKGGASGTYKVIVTFPSAVTVANASVIPDPNAPGATGSVSGFTIKGAKVTVNLTGVSNAQTIVVTLFGVSDGTNTNDVSVPMGVLLGDTTGNGAVKSGDVTLTQSKAGQTVIKSTFREDVTIDGSINSTDVNLVQSKVGTSLP